MDVNHNFMIQPTVDSTQIKFCGEYQNKWSSLNYTLSYLQKYVIGSA